MSRAEGMSLLRFQEKFATEEACREHLFYMRWPDGFRCPACGGGSYYAVTSRGLYQCRDCRHQTSLTAGTVMYKTRTPLRTWFWCIYLAAHDKRGRSALSLTSVLGISYYKAWTMLHKIRRAMAQRDAHYQLAGLVEMDDGYVGSPRVGTDGRGTSKNKVVVALSLTEEGKPCYLKMRVVPNMSKAHLTHVAVEAVTAGSTITTDGLSGYNDLGSHGFTHHVKVYKHEGPEFLKWIHTIISNAKAFIDGTYHGLGSKHLQSYLDEFCYRFNRRREQDQLFNRVVTACLAVTPVGYAELTQ